MQEVSVIGCGHWGKNLVRNFAELGSLASVSDPDTRMAEIYATEYEVPSLSFEEVLLLLLHRLFCMQSLRLPLSKLESMYMSKSPWL